MITTGGSEAIEIALQSENAVSITGSFYLAEEAVLALEQRGISFTRKDHRPEVE